MDDVQKKTCGLIICDGEFPMQFPNKDILFSLFNMNWRLKYLSVEKYC